MKSKSKKYFRKKTKKNKKNKTKKIKPNKKNKKGGDKCSSSISSNFDINKASYLTLKDVYNKCCPRQKGKYFGTTKNKTELCKKIDQNLIHTILNESNTFNSSYDERPTSIETRPTSIETRPSSIEKSSSTTPRPSSIIENQYLKGILNDNDWISQQPNPSPKLDFSRLDVFEEKSEKEDEKEIDDILGRQTIKRPPKFGPSGFDQQAYFTDNPELKENHF